MQTPLLRGGSGHCVPRVFRRGNRCASHPKGTRFAASVRGPGASRQTAQSLDVCDRFGLSKVAAACVEPARSTGAQQIHGSRAVRKPSGECPAVDAQLSGRTDANDAATMLAENHELPRMAT